MARGESAVERLTATLTSVSDVVHRIFTKIFTDQQGAHFSIKIPFSLGEQLLIRLTAPGKNIR